MSDPDRSEAKFYWKAARISDRIIQIHACIFRPVGALEILLIGIVFIIIFDLGMGGAARYIGAPAFGTDSRMDGDGGGEYFSVFVAAFL